MVGARSSGWSCRLAEDASRGFSLRPVSPCTYVGCPLSSTNLYCVSVTLSHRTRGHALFWFSLNFGFVIVFYNNRNQLSSLVINITIRVLSIVFEPVKSVVFLQHCGKKRPFGG